MVRNPQAFQFLVASAAEAAEASEAPQLVALHAREDACGAWEAMCLLDDPGGKLRKDVENL